MDVAEPRKNCEGEAEPEFRVLSPFNIPKPFWKTAIRVFNYKIEQTIGNKIMEER